MDRESEKKNKRNIKTHKKVKRKKEDLLKIGMLAHICIPDIGRVRQKDCLSPRSQGQFMQNSKMAP